MDKNTLTGFLLMGAVIVGFGIWNRPSAEEMSTCASTAKTQSNGVRNKSKKQKR